jgi:hypothetical protein
MVGLRYALTAVLLIAPLAQAEEAINTAGSSPATTVTFYHRAKGSGALSLLDGENKSELIRLDMQSFVTIKLLPGQHTFRLHYRLSTDKPTVFDIVSGKRNFVRVRVPDGWFPWKSQLGIVEAVSCETARDEAGKMRPLKAKNIKVPMSQVVDEGAYFTPNCSQVQSVAASQTQAD